MKISFRSKYFLGHLSISVIIAAIALWLVFGIWYVTPLYSAVGVTKIFIILLAVDVSLGPLLTLIIANPRKPKRELRLDLLLIAIAQLSALFYGIHKIELGRPIWIAFDVYRFEVVQAAIMDYSELNREVFYNQQPLFSKPNWVAVTPPKDGEDKSARLFYELEQGYPPSSRPIFYQKLDLAWPEIKKNAQHLSLLHNFNQPAKVDAVLQEYPTADGYIPLLSPQVDMAVLINRQQRIILDIVDLRPW